MLIIKKRNLIFLIIVFTLIGAGITWGSTKALDFLSDDVSISQNQFEEYKKLKENYGKLATLQHLIEETYYLPVDSEKLYEGMYKGLFWGIGDPYSSYLTSKEYEELMMTTTGEYEGIGVTIAPDQNGYIKVVAPMDDSPAERAGIKSGDKIISVDGVEYRGDSIDRAASAMRGKEGTKVKIGVMRGNETFELEIIRASITLETVKSELLDNGIGYIRISSFEERTADDFGKALRDIEANGAKGLIIDLRDNPGGLVDVCIEVADYLLPEGVVTFTENKKGERKYFKSNPGATSLPFVVLVNGGTASAGEIVAGAVKDHEQGIVVGTKTYGKGIIQEILPLDAGDAIKLTIMQYFSPKGNTIHEIGLEPDYVVELSEEDFVNGELPREKDKQLKKAIELLEQ